MPSLVLSARFTTDSQILREAARGLGWETVRIEGREVPDWFDPEDGQVALFYTAPHAFEISGQLSRVLLGCDPAWATRLPHEFLHRELRQTTLGEALELPGQHFIKHSVSKAFPAQVYDAGTLAEATAKLLPSALVHVIEPVEWEVEYRCFVLEGVVVAISPYRRGERIREDHTEDLGVSEREQDAALEFATLVLDAVTAPPAFVLDVGLIKERGWAVVEVNECWASGIYSCEPHQVLRVLLRGCVLAKTLGTDQSWDFQKHYESACP